MLSSCAKIEEAKAQEVVNQLFEYIEKGRRPWKYRPAGPAMVRHDTLMPYPRICAHRGFNSVAPENSMPAFGAAVAMGAEEIEFDLWETADGEIVSIHDPVLDRVSNGSGKIWEYTLDELREFDFGIKYGEAFSGMRIATFEDILKKFKVYSCKNVFLNGELFHAYKPGQYMFGYYGGNRNGCER